MILYYLVDPSKQECFEFDTDQFSLGADVQELEQAVQANQLEQYLHELCDDSYLDPGIKKEDFIKDGQVDFEAFAAAELAAINSGQGTIVNRQSKHGLKWASIIVHRVNEWMIGRDPKQIKVLETDQLLAQIRQGIKLTGWMYGTGKQSELEMRQSELNLLANATPREWGVAKTKYEKYNSK